MTLSTAIESMLADSAFGQLAMVERMALLLTVATLLASCLFLLLIVLDRLRLAQLRVHESRVQVEWRPLFLALSAGEPVKPRTLETMDAAIVLKLWMRMLRNVQGNARQRLVEFAAASHFADAARWLNQRGHRERLLGLATLAELADEQDLPLFRRALWSRSIRVSLIAARGLLRAGYEDGLRELLQAYAIGLKHPRFVMHALLQECAPEMIERVLQQEMDTHDILPLRLVPLLDLLPLPVARKPLRKLLDSGDPESASAALKVVQDPAMLDEVRKACHSEYWYVRAQAARALALVGLPEDEMLLRERLDDPNWWVRRRAAEALLKLVPTADGHELLALLRMEQL